MKLLKFILRVFLNGIALYIADRLFEGFIINGGVMTIIIGALTLALLNILLRPIIKFITAPLIWLTFGVFNIAINVFLLWVADLLLTQISIDNLFTLFWVSIIVAIANII